MLALVPLGRPTWLVGAGSAECRQALGACLIRAALVSRVITVRGPAQRPAPPESAAAGHQRSVSRGQLPRLSLHWGTAVMGTAGKWRRLWHVHAAAPAASTRRVARSNRPRHSRCGPPRARARERSCPVGRCAAGLLRSAAVSARTPRPLRPRSWSSRLRAAQRGRRASKPRRARRAAAARAHTPRGPPPLCSRGAVGQPRHGWRLTGSQGSQGLVWVRKAGEG